MDLLACGSRRPTAFPRLSPQWPLAGRSPLTVARQRRIQTDFPHPLGYSVVRTIMVSAGVSGVLALGHAGLLKGHHLVEETHRSAHDRQRKHRPCSLAETQVEVEQWAQAEVLEGRGVAQLTRLMRRDHVVVRTPGDGRGR